LEVDPVEEPTAVATLNEIIAGRKVGWVLEADLKNFFGSLDHEWVMRIVEHRVGDPRILNLIKRWLKADVLDEEGTPQGGSISVLLSNLYLHYVLDLWFEKAIKPRMEGEAYLVRYRYDFVVCFQYRSDAVRVQEVLTKRLQKFTLTLELSKTKLVEFSRYAQKYAGKRGRKRPKTLKFLGFTFYCSRNLKGNFRVGMRTENIRVHRSMQRLSDLMRRMMHLPIQEQVKNLNSVQRGHYAYFGIAGNYLGISRVYRSVER